MKPPEYVSHFIGGANVRSSFLKSFPATDPATGTDYTQVAVGLAADINQAVLAAQAAMTAGSWPEQGPAERAKLLDAVAAATNERAADITAAEVLGTGLPVSQAREQVALAAAAFREAADQIRDLGDDGETAAAYADRRPAGIAGVITSWRNPFLAQARAVAPALAAGCPVILKTDELTPLPGWLLAEIATAAGLPGGVLNIVHGSRHPRAPGAQARDALLAHPAVGLITFTGDPAAGHEILAAAAAGGKQARAQLAARAPLIILAGADLDQAVDAAVFGAFWLGGQRRTASTAILAERPVYAEVVRRLAARAGQIQAGPPDDEATEVGPVVHAECYERLRSWIRLGLREGARVVAGGRAPAGLTDGSYLAPTVLADVEASMRAFGEQVSGPVLSVTPVDSPAEAAAVAAGMSDVPAVYLWTADVPRARRLAAEIGAPATWINSRNAADVVASAAGIDFFTRVHAVHIGSGEDKTPLPLLGA